MFDSSGESRPTDRVVDAVPRRAGKEDTCCTVGLQMLHPATDRVGMQHESSGRLGRRPVPPSHDLENLQSIRRRIMRPLLGRDSFAFMAEHGQFPFEQCGIPGHGIPSYGQAYDRRRMRGQTCPCEHVVLSDGNGDGINELEN